MDSKKLLRDLVVFCLVSLFYLIILSIKLYMGRDKSSPFKFRAELTKSLANKNFIWLFSAIYLFTAMYAVKNVVARILFMFIYLIFVIKLVQADLNSRGK